MSNFTFVRETIPTLHDDCARAESYLTNDPRSAVFYSRRVVERLVDHLYALLSLPEPYRTDAAAKMNAAPFKSLAGNAIVQKLNLIRKFGNDAVHDDRPTRPDAALHVLRELFHVMVWAGFHHSQNPQAVPTGSQFDPALAAKAAPLSRDEVVRLAERFQAQDRAHAAALKERDELAAAQDAEIARLRAEIADAQARLTLVDDHDYNEADTRDRFIDLLLRESGWTLDDPRDTEFEVAGMPNAEGVGYVDYVLWGADGLPLAVVEAKRTKRSPQIGQQQAMLYADCLERAYGRRPVIFYTNGYEHWLWDDTAGYPPREVQGFHTRDELGLMIQRRGARRILSAQPVNADIAGRPYQIRAIKAVGEAFDTKQREALLVMATGSGKTRTVIALVDQLMKSGWVKRVLFLADRTALVNQATNAFKVHLPEATTVNLVTERSGDGRVFVSTYPTMLNLINAVTDDERRFGPGFFDLVIIDEAHRSVYAKYGAIFEYFDSLLIGLTATPKDEVDHNTYRLFNLEDGVPTDDYSLDEAVRDGYLVPPKGVAVGTKFLRSGIKYAELSEAEKDEWDALEWGGGGPPDEVGAEELNRFLFNEDTVDKVLATLMADGLKVAGGDRLGKTIIFAKSQQHAEFIQQRFDVQWPEHAGHFARVITHGTPYAQSLIDSFSETGKAPHIAISVDMLDTGIDVPDVVNLVFFKMVRSKTKFWQMIGRGTRLRPDLFGPGQDKIEFLVFDFCGNLEFFSQDLPTSEGSTQKSLSQRLFEGRVALVAALDKAGEHTDLRESTVGVLHEFVAGMNLDNILVRPWRRDVEHFANPATWQTMTQEDAERVFRLGGLPTAVHDTDEDAKRFDLLVLKRQLAQLQGDAIAMEQVRETVQAIAAALLGKTAIPSVAEQAVLLEAVAGDEWWVDVTLPMLEVMRLRLRALVRFVDKVVRKPVFTDFEDTLSEAQEVFLPGIVPGVDRERFRAKATAYLRQHEDHVALQRLRRNKQLTPEDLAALEQMLVDSGGEREAIDELAAERGGLGLFVRSLVGLDRAAAVEAFGQFLDGGAFSSDQIRFINLIVDELTATGVMEPGRLFESPFTDHAPTGPDYVFPDADVEAIVDTLHRIRRNAVPSVPA
ncbi:MAG: DEAD/DEAH box helicase family protein [Intrasporangiaceae bacterium]|nr:DEAD/DEAH box helicase family protein [Intrasporangiaceae bacterium]